MATEEIAMRFSLLDRVLEIEPGRSITAVKAVTLSEEYLADHFPRFPVLPGVLMLEAMTQAAAWTIRLGEDFAHSIVVLRAARNVKYGDFVEPGKTLTVTADEADMRLDRFLGARFPQIAFTPLQRIARTGHLRVDGARVKPNDRLVEGQRRWMAGRHPHVAGAEVVGDAQGERQQPLRIPEPGQCFPYGEQHFLEQLLPQYRIELIAAHRTPELRRHAFHFRPQGMHSGSPQGQSKTQ
jgi:3-hydroxymyristoyl/3-hydroxydecanoyl-(acyl carrier protein) dehydratase